MNNQSIIQRLEVLEEQNHVDSSRELIDMGLADVNESVRKLRDFIIAMNENLNALQEKTNEYSTKKEVEGLNQKFERKINNLMDLQLRNAISDI